ncbi:hypothetical protein SVAN01_10342 [Stagonosporopsis vannaccii]|nr:hypothetical protein SVAN01_10342 [Stagonosporopsis vannaccii]
MPPRIARSSLSTGGPSKPKGRAPGERNAKKASKRALNAFAIAQYDNPEKTKIRKNRLGELDPSFYKKRARDDDDEDSDADSDDEDGGAARKKVKRRGGDDSFDEGSDSEGNTWTMGHVDEDDDEDIDSDEAFGESDEERFEGYSFRGSSKRGKNLRVKSKGKIVDDGSDVDMGESDEEEDEEGDDFGDEGIDLATALDQYEEDEREEKRERERERKKKKVGAFDGSDSEEPSEGEDVGRDGASDLSSDDDEDEEDRQAQLKDLISSLATGDEDKSKGKRVEVHESAAPDEFGVSRKVDLFSLKPKAGDDEKKKALKLLRDDKNAKRSDIARKLDAPLPKRQQDKLDRAAANAKANETLDRWTDTIKQNRRAEHLSFPLQHKDAGKAMGEDRLLPTTTAAPANDLESTIQSILQQSGLSNGKDDEEQIQKWEILQTNKLPIEEVEKRRAQLRMERELLFREEVRAKRVKKIKSKAYRRVHRKERERLLEKEREQLKADGVDLSEEEREHNDRRRAEERMGAKHRESKWAKGIKATGRAGWDQDALAGVTEMAKRNEELRRRIEGKEVRDSDDEASDVPSDDNESEDESADDDELLQRQLGQLENPFSEKGSKLGQMAFMQKAEAAKRAENNQAIEAMRRELAGENSEDEVGDNATRVGRRRYGPGKVVTTAIPVKGSEFEEHPGSDEEAGQTATTGLSNGARKDEKPKNPFSAGVSNSTRRTQKNGNTAEPDVDAPNPFLAKAAKAKKSKKDAPADDDLLPFTSFADEDDEQPAPKETVDDFLQQRVTAADDDGWATVLGGQDSEPEIDSDEGDDLDLTALSRNHALTAKGFAGDNVEADFKLEKADTTRDEASKETTDFLPGWGSWAGDGMSKAEKRRNRGWKTTTAVAGIDAHKRKDRALDRVIINEKTVKPNKKYMAAALPFPFESKEQYERSLRQPKGREWSTKKTHQDATLPRVLVKGGVIAPMRKPLA